MRVGEPSAEQPIERSIVPAPVLTPKGEIFAPAAAPEPEPAIVQPLPVFANPRIEREEPDAEQRKTDIKLGIERLNEWKNLWRDGRTLLTR